MPCKPKSSSHNQQSCSISNCNNCFYEKGHGTLNDRIQCYKKNYDALVKQENQFYKDASSIEEAILRAAKSQNENGQMNNHQKRLGKKLCFETAEKLIKQSGIIIEAQKNGFDALYNCILGYTQSINGVGELYAYDVSERLATYFSLSIQNVYLHAGTRKGAENLGLKKQNDKISHDSLPNVLKTNLSADEVENFLCICQCTLSPRLLE